MDEQLQTEAGLPVTRENFEIPPQMVDAIAAGLEEPAEIAARYGFSGSQWTKLAQWKPFLDAVSARKAEFERDGYTFRLKRAMQADVLSDRYYQYLLSNDVTLPQLNEGVKLFAKLGDLEPKPAVQTAQGSGFSITINLGDIKRETPAATVVDVKATPIESDATDE